MINIDKINVDEALRYMGYKKDINIDNISHLLKQCEEYILNQVKYRYCYKIFDIEKTDNSIKLLNTNLNLVGKSIYNHLENCNKAILMSCTLSDSIDRLINKLNVTDMSSALICDSMASALIEQLCDQVENIIRNEHNIKNMTWRYSPGYGDLPISIQKDFIKTINANKQIGITVTDSNILIPRKSVTAIIGISDKPLPPQKRGCAICNMNKSCQFRKRGTHCGF